MNRLCRFASTSNYMKAIQNITVVGGGLMGSGIAQVAAQTGHKVKLVEVNEEQLRKAEGMVERSVQRVAKKLYKDKPLTEADEYIQKVIGLVEGVTDPSKAVDNCDLVIEAIVENMQAKHDLFKALDKAAPQKTIFASNTSSLPVSEIAAVTNRKDRFIGVHFFNPVPVMKLVELIRTADTSDDTFEKLQAFVQFLAKVPVVCKDTPGFVVNRLLVTYLAEAIRMHERGDASACDIDTAMKLGAGHPMGPLQLADFVGLDTLHAILSGWAERFPDNPLFRPLSSVEKMIADGKLGVKSGEGFFKYSK